MDKFLKHSRRIETTDLDWELAARVGISATEAEVLTYFADIEGQTIFYLKELLMTNAARDPEVVAFLTTWNYEEFFHAEGIAQLLEVCGHPLEQGRKTEVRTGVQLSAKVEAAAQTLLSKLFPSSFPTLSMTWGASQEMLTLRGYEQLTRTTENPVLAELCRRIAKQERRHFAWYYNNARTRLAESKMARRLTRRIFSAFWSPVGAGVKSDTEVAKLCARLFPGQRFLEVAAEIDAKMARLPGLEGLNVIEDYAHRALITGTDRQLAAGNDNQLAASA
ncbi:MAG: hypothetical protein KJO07_02080 [Deltaproteobacteria bacterium]|nr:hypothetical protein [Deltaproteobacteria bacterium]